MGITLKNVPKSLVGRLKTRAKANHRSMQDEVMCILEKAVTPKMSIEEIVAWTKKMGIRSPSESAEIVREMRDTR